MAGSLDAACDNEASDGMASSPRYGQNTSAFVPTSEANLSSRDALSSGQIEAEQQIVSHGVV